MSFVKRTVQVPTETDVLQCDGCGADIDTNEHNTRLRSSKDDQGALHFCERKCRARLLMAARDAFGTTATSALLGAA